MPKILIIEDDILYLSSIETILKLNGYGTVTAMSGFDGIKLAINELPDLIISDINMPDKSGLDVLSTLRQDYRTMQIPFIFITALTDHSDVRKGMALGAEDYITKPFNENEILLSIETRLKRKSILEDFYKTQLDNFRKSVSMMIPHEMRTPLTGIIGLSEYVMQESETMKRSELKELITHINTSSKRLYNVISRYIFYSNLIVEISHKDSFKKENLTFTNDLIIEIYNELIKFNTSQYIVNFDLLSKSEVSISLDYFHRIVYELLDNAIKFSFSETEITFKTYIENENFIIYIKNYGRGLDKAQLRSIGAFIQFNRDIYEQQGVGLGLTLVKMITELHGGEFLVDSKYGSYFEVTIKIPIGA